MRNLFEGIVGTGTQPKYFWLCTDIPNMKNPSEDQLDKLAHIARGELEGVKGISDSKEIVVEWFMMGRNACIIMDSNELLRQNDIEKIEYDDPDLLCRNNLEMVFRLYDKRSDKWGTIGLLTNLAQLLQPYLSKYTDHIGHYLSYSGLPRIFENHFDAVAFEANSLFEFSNWVWGALQRFKEKEPYRLAEMEKDLDRDKLFFIVKEAFKRLGTTYASEAEWLVRSTSLHIPRGSRMLIGIDIEIKDETEKWIAAGRPDDMQWGPNLWRFQNYDRMMQRIKEFDIESYYRVTYVDSRRFEEIRPKTMFKRRKKREQQAGD